MCQHKCGALCGGCGGCCGKHYKVTKSPRKTAIVLRCPDPRFSGAHALFVRKVLQLSQSVKVSLKRAGGAISLARAETLCEEHRSVMDEISMFVEMHPELTHIIVINHEDCRKYDNAKVEKNPEKPNPELDDLTRAATILSATYPHLQIGAYFARFSNRKKTRISFKVVFETDPAKSLRKQ